MLSSVSQEKREELSSRVCVKKADSVLLSVLAIHSYCLEKRCDRKCEKNEENGFTSTICFIS